jgi:HPr kinase/phosphorylase
VRKIFGYELPCCVFTYGFDPIPIIHELADKHGCPILQTDLTSAEFSSRLLRVLSNVFASWTTVHGVLMEVFGIGMLIQGPSGVGKSESALALIERGHRLVADDVVEISCVNGNVLLGKGNSPVTSHHMEIRGLGIINITHLFGVGAVRDEKRVQMVIQLEEWDPKKEYDRVGGETSSMEMMGVQVPRLIIPIRPGRNVSIIIETAAMNERLKMNAFETNYLTVWGTDPYRDLDGDGFVSGPEDKDTIDEKYRDFIDCNDSDDEVIAPQFSGEKCLSINPG